MSRQPAIEDRIRALPCWRGLVDIEPLPGGLTNMNMLVRCEGQSFVARFGIDTPAHGIDRGVEALVSAAAARIGLAPGLVFAGDGFLVFHHVAGRTLSAADLGREPYLGRTVDRLRRCRDEMPIACDFALPDRRPIPILKGYLAQLAAPSHRWHGAAAPIEPRLKGLSQRLAGRPVGFAHNDIHAGNLIDDGSRLWLIDWEYAGAGDPLVDLASLINNSDLEPMDEVRAAELWLGRAPDAAFMAELADLRLAAALRDLLWGYVQDGLAGGLADYIAINRRRVDRCAAQARL